MKRLNNAVLFLCILVLLCLLPGCQKGGGSAVPLPEEAAVLDALEKSGLPGTIHESESQISPQTEGGARYVRYVIWEEIESSEDVETGWLVANLTSADYKGRRVMDTLFFEQSAASKQIAWADWKPHMAFAALVWGGLDSEDEIYQAFCEKELPEGEHTYTWEAQLSGGYRTVSYSLRPSRTVYDEAGFEVKEQSAHVRVSLYESRELYEELRTNPNGTGPEPAEP